MQSNIIACFKTKLNNFNSLIYLFIYFHIMNISLSALVKKKCWFGKKSQIKDFSCSMCFPWDRKFDSKHTLKLVGHQLISVELIYAEILNRRKKQVTTNWRNSFLNNALPRYTMIARSCIWCTTPQSFNLPIQEKQNWAWTTSVLRYTKII